ncbi:transposase [Alteromonadaceae bacterium M269]|nr:transposase [Alteromonadaceae bacterium M269]
MNSFPVPYPEELIYSTVARSSVRYAITSPKVLLELVYNDRKVVATLDLPSHLSAIESLLQQTKVYPVERIVYEHTMFPLYAPFVDKDVRNQVLKYMCSRSYGRVHLMLGAAASIVKSPYSFRCCFDCILEQQKEVGEVYWSRLWFLPGLTCCPLHGQLTDLIISPHTHRHEFQPLTLSLLKRAECYPSKTNLVAQKIANSSLELLDIPPSQLPEMYQWSQFYKNIAHDLGCTRGKHVCHEKIYEKVYPVIPAPELERSIREETGWLRSIFRKHRKSFSYLQHLTVYHALLPNVSLAEIVNIVCRISSPKSRILMHLNKVTPDSIMVDKRTRWSELVLEYGVKASRYTEFGQALYAWLYRNDKTWLLEHNAKHRKVDTRRFPKVNWSVRDVSLCKMCFRNLYVWESELNLPRLSKLYLLMHLPNWRSISKRLDKLPRLKHLLESYQETVPEYQVRRLIKAYRTLKMNEEKVVSWRLMRLSGLSKHRMSPLAQDILQWINKREKLISGRTI